MPFLCVLGSGHRHIYLGQSVDGAIVCFSLTAVLSQTVDFFLILPVCTRTCVAPANLLFFCVCCCSLAYDDHTMTMIPFSEMGFLHQGAPDERHSAGVHTGERIY